MRLLLLYCRLETLLPQPLQLPQHNDIRVQESVDALPHAGLLVLVELSVLDRTGGDAFAETCVCQTVDGYNSNQLLSL